MITYKYIFDCPLHGEEWTVGCYRASDRKYVDRWKKYKIETEEIHLH